MIQKAQPIFVSIHLPSEASSHTSIVLTQETHCFNLLTNDLPVTFLFKRILALCPVLLTITQLQKLYKTVLLLRLGLPNKTALDLAREASQIYCFSSVPLYCCRRDIVVLGLKHAVMSGFLYLF